MFRFFLVFLFQFVILSSNGQIVTSKKYHILGIVKSDKGDPILQYKIALKTTYKDSVYAITTTDNGGYFQISGIKPGRYYLTGDSSKQTGPLYKKVNLLGDSLNIDLGIIVLSNIPILLSEVKVKGYKNFLERKTDRLIVNIENSPLANGSNSMDIMKKLPAVVVQGGQIFVNGSNSVSILIDGKPASTNKTDLSQVLKSLSSTSIEKIEIITNPPAAFDAQNDNIINIVLKKDRMFSNVSLSHDQRILPVSGNFMPDQGGESISANLYATINKLRISAAISNTYNYDKPGFPTDYSRDETPFFTRTSQTIPNTGSDFLSTKVNLGYDFSNKDILDFQISLFSIPYSKASNYSQNIFYGHFPIPDSTINLYIKLRSHSYQPSSYLSFTHYLNTKRTDFISGSATFGFSHYYPNTTFTGEGNTSQLAQMEDYSTNVKSIKVDYKKVRKLSTSLGAKYTESNNDQLILQTNENANHFHFNEKVAAGYINLSGQTGSVFYQAGLRDEYTRSEGNAITSDVNPIVNSYNELYPSFTLQYKFHNKSNVNFSASRRITRPNYENFNPYSLLTLNPYLTRSGNPEIQPLFTAKYEVSYTWRNFTLSVNYQDKRNVRVVALNYVSRDTIRTHAANIDEKNFVGALSYSIDIKSWWSVLANVNFYDYNLFLLNNITKRSASFNFYLNQDFKLSSISKVEVNFQYISSTVIDYVEYTGHCDLSTSLNTTLGKNSNFDLSIGIDDILATNRADFIYNYITVVSDSKPLVNERMLTVGLTYKFRTSSKFNSRTKRPDDFGEIRY